VEAKLPRLTVLRPAAAVLPPADNSGFSRDPATATFGDAWRALPY
jgi:hypothetical protein